MTNGYVSRRAMGRMPTAPVRKLGTWKLAYADFLTALMAFFLVMWLVSGVSDEDKAELAREFGAPPIVLASPVPDANAVMAANIAAQLSATSSDNITVTQSGDEIRIDLRDLDERPLFDLSDSALNPTGMSLAQAAGLAISGFDFPISIEGHTDAHPTHDSTRTNWELSSDRANAARRALLQSGVNANRIQAVTGLADTQPLFPDAPYLPANRRISIVMTVGE